MRREQQTSSWTSATRLQPAAKELLVLLDLAVCRLEGLERVCSAWRCQHMFCGRMTGANYLILCMLHDLAVVTQTSCRTSNAHVRKAYIRKDRCPPRIFFSLLSSVK